MSLQEGYEMSRSVSATLIALAALVLPVQASTISISGNYTGTVISNLTIVGPNSVGTQTVSGAGNLAPFGSFTFTASNDATFFGPTFVSNTLTNGIFTDTFGGGTLFGTYTGNGLSNPSNTTELLNYVFTGGTGVFLGDTGSSHGTANIINGTGAISYTGMGSLTTTPIPSTRLMLLSGLVGLAFFVYRGSKKTSTAALAAA
jgi:hypothetical protein